MTWVGLQKPHCDPLYSAGGACMGHRRMCRCMTAFHLPIHINDLGEAMKATLWSIVLGQVCLHGVQVYVQECDSTSLTHTYSWPGWGYKSHTVIHCTRLEVPVWGLGICSDVWQHFTHPYIFMTWAGLQKPHCDPLYSARRACMGCRPDLVLPSPSMVVISQPSHMYSCTRHWNHKRWQIVHVTDSQAD